MNLVDKLTEKVRSKLRGKSFGPYRVMQLATDTVTIDEDGVRNKVAIDRVTVAPDSNQPSAPPSEPRLQR